jgi:hypothetical protein
MLKNREKKLLSIFTNFLWIVLSFNFKTLSFISLAEFFIRVWLESVVSFLKEVKKLIFQVSSLSLKLKK